ncbi:heterokaryon incompatibility protein-domain-containing protein [Aspergillus caelatus]|uniref:Heterokaryon incompatibility protein-domain-containing protein n=1 Tax=Aspergillus caelatus TaxID=61420 RepID=A0A5N7ACV9_9EURO|nr:heterokaryon incompatibility protein-domain-containing protein [Aspergillus caelatus]KAE8367503.1 heterokaryon incompatibility protein-domain-containing protein [Aspergillus caelatus]
MSPNPEHTSHVILRSFTYPTLPQEPYTTRMIRLLPNKDKSAPIQCELFNYDLSETGGGAHLYQALSYVWGSEEKPESIILNGCTFHVTTNLHSALLHLRNRQLERTLWIDAICINQDEEDQGHEKSKQIPLMRMIYAQAERVIVWLGDATENGDKALDGIRCLAEEQYTASTLNTSENYDACLRLLQQDWFSRIWVLQEVGVARCVNIMCGSVSINGHIFCEGLTRLRLSPNLRSRIGPVAYLIRGALYRPTYEFGSRGPIFIGELIGMYHHHNATKQHDKVYALLGLCADPITAVREPNYNLPWKEVFKEVTNSLFPECSVETWNEIGTVVIKGKGWILGHVDSVEEHFPEFGKQKIEVLFNNTAESLGIIDRWETNWKPQASAELIQDGDIICLLKGASKPSVIRLCKDHFTIVTPAVTPQKRQQKESPVAISQERYSTSGLCDILLTWKTSLAKTNRKEKSEIMFPLIKTPDFREEPFEARKRLKHTTLVVIDIALRILERGMPTTKVIEQLLRQSGTNDQIIKELVRVVKNEDEPSTVTLSRDPLRDQGNNLRIPEETIIAAIIDAGSYGFIIVELFLQYQGMNLPVSEEVVKAVAGRQRQGIMDIMDLKSLGFLFNKARVSQSLKKWSGQRQGMMDIMDLKS